MKLSEMKPRGVAKRKIPQSPLLLWLFDPRDMRTKQGVSLRAAADAAGVSHATLSRVERGAPPDLVTALRLAEFYGFPISMLWALPPAGKRGKS